MASTLSILLAAFVLMDVLFEGLAATDHQQRGPNYNPRDTKGISASVQKFRSMLFGCSGLEPGDANITCRNEKLENKLGSGIDCTEKVPVNTKAFFVNCPPGYGLVEDYQIISCKFPGKWDNEVFTCEEKPTEATTTIKTTPKTTNKTTTATNKPTTTTKTTVKPTNATTKPTNITTTTATSTPSTVSTASIASTTNTVSSASTASTTSTTSTASISTASTASAASTSTTSTASTASTSSASTATTAVATTDTSTTTTTTTTIATTTTAAATTTVTSPTVATITTEATTTLDTTAPTTPTPTTLADTNNYIYVANVGNIRKPMKSETYTDALADCKKDGAVIMSLDSYDQANYVAGYMTEGGVLANAKAPNDFWVGVTGGKGHWKDGRGTDILATFPWILTRPIDGTNCVVWNCKYKRHWDMSPTECSTYKQPYICQK